MPASPLPQEELRRLQVWNRSIRLENFNALMRRWRLAASGKAESIQSFDRYFPKQGPLFDLLAVCTQEQVAEMADCTTPLFTLRLRCTEFVLDVDGQRPADPLLAESQDEAFLALCARVDAVRTSPEQARVAFSLTRSEAMWLARYCPQELQALARDSSMVLYQSVNWEYFAASAAGRFGREQRTLFSAISRKAAGAALGH